MLQHKLSLAMAIVTAALITFLPFVPNISPSLAAAIVGFIGTVTTTIAKFQTPPGQATAGDVAKVALLGLLLCGCASQQTREACYAKADAVEATRAFQECTATGWQDCPSRDAIRSEARAGRAGCP
jgi:hypothetical protein